MAAKLPPSPIDARRGFLALALGAATIGGITAYNAASNEITGKAIYHKPTGAKSSVAVPITRQSDPDIFREVTNFRWGVSAISLGVAAVAFRLYRKLDDCV